MEKKVENNQYLGELDVVQNHENGYCADLIITDRLHNKKTISINGIRSYELGERLGMWHNDVDECTDCDIESCTSRQEPFYTCSIFAGTGQLVVIAALVGSDKPEQYDVALIVHWLSSERLSDSTSSMVIISRDELNKYIKILKGEKL